MYNSTQKVHCTVKFKHEKGTNIETFADDEKSTRTNNNNNNNNNKEQITPTMKARLHLFVIMVLLNYCIGNNCSLQWFQKSCRWLYGETPVTGLSNQIVTVYSFIPIATLYQAGLALGPVYSRSSFEITMKEYDKAPYGKVELHFSDLFDISPFRQLTQSMNISLFENTTQSEICLTNKSFEFAHIQYLQRMKWRSSNDAQLLLMFNTSQHLYQELLARNMTQLTCPHIIRIKSISKMLGMYDFYQYHTIDNQSRRFQWLLHIHRHIQPAPMIQSRIQSIRQSFPREYIVIHIRAEADVLRRKHKLLKTEEITTKQKQQYFFQRLSLEYQYLLKKYQEMEEQDPIFYYNLPAIISAIVNSTCYRQYKKHYQQTVFEQSKSLLPMITNESFPLVYLSSGLFSTVMDTSDEDQRGKILLEIIQALGFHSIQTKLTIATTSSSFSATFSKLGNDEKEKISFYPEQEAYIDFEIARQATCFIPAHVSSSFSYLVTRFRELDQNITKSKIRGINRRFSAFFI
jgi:hypothetical protein